MNIIHLDDIIEEIRRKYQGDYIEVGEAEQPAPPVTPPKPPATAVLTGYRYGASDADGHRGEYYFIPPAELSGQIEKVVVGSAVYKFEKKYRASELWYGIPSSGRIVVSLTNGNIYASEAVTEPTGKRIDLKFKGNTNGNRPTFYTMDGRKLQVGQKVTFQVGPVKNSFVAKVRSNSSIGCDWSDGTVVKNSDVSGRGIAVLIPAKYAGHFIREGWIEI